MGPSPSKDTGSDRGLGFLGGYLMVPPSKIQDIPLGDRPMEGQAWHSIAKGERALVASDPGDIDRHLGEVRLCNFCFQHWVPHSLTSPSPPAPKLPCLPYAVGTMLFLNLTRPGQRIRKFDTIQTTHMSRLIPTPCYCGRQLCK